MTIYNNNQNIRAPQRNAVRFLTAILLLSWVFLLDQPALCHASSETVVAKQEKFENQNNLATSLIDLTEEEKQWIQKHPTIRVSNEFDWPPFDFVVAGKPQGFGIDLMNILSERSGIVFNYVNGYTWDELVEMFLNGQIDLLHSLSITPEREEKALFSPPYYHSKNVLILRSDIADTRDLNDLEGKIIALPKGWSSIQFFEKYYPMVHIIEVESSRQALEYVDQGKVFATVEQEGIASYFIKKFGFHDLKLSKWIENEELQKTSSMHFSVLKKQPILFQILKKAHSSIEPDELARLEQKWFGRKGRQIGIEDVGLTPAEKAYLEKKETITYCISPDRMPFEVYRNGHVSGMSADFIELFSERLETAFSIVPTLSWAESLTRIKKGDCDILPMVNQTPERELYIDFTSSYLNYGIVIITRQQEGFIGGLQDLIGKKVAVPEGTFAYETISGKFPQVPLIRFPDVKKCLIQLTSGAVDAALLSLPVATYHIRHMGLDNLKVAGYSGLEDTIRIGIKKNEPLLHSIMSKLVRALPAKDIDSISQESISLTFEHRFDYSHLWKSLGVIGIFVIFVLIWNRQLVKLNRQITEAHNELEVKSQELERLSVTDPLTGLYNRRHIETTLVAEIKRHTRYMHNLSIIIIDLDNFKQVNDTYGHQIGDMVLIEFSNMLKTGIRESDVASRWGGEEFLIICPENDLKGSSIQAENIRNKLNTISFAVSGRQTASFGVACYEPGEGGDNLVRRADDALYIAKNSGKNRIETAQPVISTEITPFS